MRRIGRRMGLQYLDNMTAYADFLRKNPEESELLFKDLLISVTSFFREPEAFDALIKEMIRKQGKSDTGAQSIRIWVPGCATGEEAYTLAIIFQEQFRAAGLECRLHIFATDIDERALEIARAGIYPESIAADVSAERLSRFFTKEDSTYRVRESIRETVTFARQNLIGDPPFSRLDLISCRNLMIYLKPELQRRVLTLFHFALNDGGFLFLGSTESVGPQSDLFEKVDKKSRLYRRLPTKRRHPDDFPLGRVDRGEHAGSRKEGAGLPATGRRPASRLAEITRSLLLDKYSPASVLVNQRYQVQYYHGPVDRYLKRPSGVPTDDLVSQAREGLDAKLRAALHKAEKEGRYVSLDGGRVRRDDGNYQDVKISVEPVDGPDEIDGLLLVVFNDEPAPVAQEKSGRSGTPGSEQEVVRELEQELKTTREDLHGTIEELESSNEELKSSNEEIMSMNEELQSSNEELDSSKEELQSMNEELNTVNSQLQHKVEELETLNNDLDNLLASTDIATLFLDREGRIKRFTPAIRNLFNLIASDLDRPIGDISHHFDGHDLFSRTEEVLETLAPQEQEVYTVQGRWYLQRITPYRTKEGHIEGVVIVFIDITERKEMERRTRRLATVVRDSNDAITVLDFQGNILDWNHGAERIYGWTREEVLGKSIEVLVPEELREDTVALFRRLEKGETVESFETRRRTRDGRELDVWLTVTAVADDSGELSGVATTERDVTERKRSEQALRDAKASAEEANAQKSRFLSAASHDLRQPLQTLKLLNNLLQRRDLPWESLDLVAQQADVLTVMANLLNALLDISQLESGVVRPQKIPFGVNELLSNLHAEFGQQIREKELEIHVRPCRLWVYSDRGLVERILHNFLSNALKYTETGKILVGCRRRGANMRIEVWDTGRGITEDKFNDIFSEFYQVNNPDRDRSKGLGLGLSIVKRLSDLLDHDVHVRSTPGEGSVFAIELPVYEKDTASPARAVSRPEADAGDVHSSRILLIEDDGLVAFPLVRILKSEGFEVRHVKNGDDAVREIRDERFAPDILLSDYRLPGNKSGLQVVDNIRELLARPVPAIILTGDTYSLEPKEVEEHQCRLLYKPIDADTLTTLITRLAEGEKG